MTSFSHSLCLRVASLSVSPPLLGLQLYQVYSSLSPSSFWRSTWNMVGTQEYLMIKWIKQVINQLTEITLLYLFLMTKQSILISCTRFTFKFSCVSLCGHCYYGNLWPNHPVFKVLSKSNTQGFSDYRVFYANAHVNHGSGQPLKIRSQSFPPWLCRKTQRHANLPRSHFHCADSCIHTWTWPALYRGWTCESSVEIVYSRIPTCRCGGVFSAGDVDMLGQVVKKIHN